MSHSFHEAAMVLLGHGSSADPKAAAAVAGQAARLRQRGLFASVTEAFLRHPPSLEEALANAPSSHLLVVPVFISEGYLTEEVIPLRLGLGAVGQTPFGRQRQIGSQTLYYCRPVGTHPLMTDILLDQVSDVLDRAPFPRRPMPSETTLCLAAHGTLKNSRSRQAVEYHAARIRARQLYAEVHCVFLEEEPKVSAVYHITRTLNLVVAPFFIGDGPHTQEDIPLLLGEPRDMIQSRLARGLAPWRNPLEKHGKRVWLAASPGLDQRLSEVILARAAEALSGVETPAVA